MNNQHTPLPNKWIIWLYRVHLATRHKWLMTAHWCISLTQICDLSFLHWYLGWKSLHCIVPDERLQYKQGKSEWCDSCDRPSNVTQVGFKSSIFRRVWPSNLMDDLTNNRAPVLCYVTLSALFQKPSVNSNCSYCPETPNSGQNQQLLLNLVASKFDGWPWKTTGHLFYATEGFVRHFAAMCEFNWSYSPKTTKLGQNLFLPLLLWPLTSDLHLSHGNHVCQWS